MIPHIAMADKLAEDSCTASSLDSYSSEHGIDNVDSAWKACNSVFDSTVAVGDTDTDIDLDHSSASSSTC